MNAADSELNRKRGCRSVEAANRLRFRFDDSTLQTLLPRTQDRSSRGLQKNEKKMRTYRLQEL
jgi:hypothetical protein